MQENNTTNVGTEASFGNLTKQAQSKDAIYTMADSATFTNFSSAGFTRETNSGKQDYKGYPLSFGYAHCTKWSMLSVAYLGQDGKPISAGVIYLNNAIKQKIMSGADQTETMKNVLCSKDRKCMAGRRYVDGCFVRTSIPVRDPVSKVVYGCNAFIMTCKDEND